jgi:hypothetical protein
MSRSPSARFKAGVFAQETGEAFLVLLSISHPDMETPIRLANNYSDVVSNGETYIGFPFGIALPGDSDENLPQTQIAIDNVDQRVIQAIRELSGPPTMTISVVLADTPGVIEAGPFAMTLREVNYDDQVITATVAYEDVLNEPYPGDFFTPANFPGLF